MTEVPILTHVCHARAIQLVENGLKSVKYAVNTMEGKGIFCVVKVRGKTT